MLAQLYCVRVCACARVHVHACTCVHDRQSVCMSRYSHDKNNKSVEGLLALANTFIAASGANTRHRICALGEPLLSRLIGMWSRSQPTVRVRREKGRGGSGEIKDGGERNCMFERERGRV